MRGHEAIRRGVAAMVVMASVPALAQYAPPSGPASPVLSSQVKVVPSGEPAAGAAALFVGRSVRPAPRSGVRVEVGVEAQVVPMRLAIAANRESIIESGIAAACTGSNQKDCQATARANVDQALQAIGGMSDAEMSRLQSSSSLPAEFEQQLKAAGVTDPRQVKAVKDYVSSMPVAKRSSALELARGLTQNDSGDVRLEPFVRVDLRQVELRVGVPMSVGASSGSAPGFALGNLELAARTGWNYAGRNMDLGLSLGMALDLPTATTSLGSAVMANVFTAPKYFKDRLTVSPYVAVGLDARWVALQAYGEMVLVNRVKGSSGAAFQQYFRYGTGVVLMPRFPVSIIGELAGCADVGNAAEFGSLFAVAGLQFRIARLSLGFAAQVPLWEAAKVDLGSYDGMDVGRLAHLSVLARTSLSF